MTLKGTVTNLLSGTDPVYAQAVLDNRTTPPLPSQIDEWNTNKTVLATDTVTNGAFEISHLEIDQRGSTNGVKTLWLEVYQDTTTNGVLDYFEPMTQMVVSVTNHTMDYEVQLDENTSDFDRDLIPDWWEVENGLSITNAVDAFADGDGDWIDNLWEYRLDLDPAVSNANNYAFADAMRAVDSRIEGLNPTNAIHIFNTDCYETTNFMRNTNCWAADLNLTMCSPWNDQEPKSWKDGRNKAGTLISPRHALFVNHLWAGKAYWLAPGRSLRFIDATNGVYDVEIESVDHICENPPLADLTVATLVTNVPTDRFSFVKVLPDNFTNYIGHTDIHIPGLCLDQEEKALVHELNSIGLGQSNVLVGCTYQLPICGARTNYYDLNEDEPPPNDHPGVIDGDSGNPAFVILNDEPVLTTLWVTPGSGAGTPITSFKDEINAVMNSNSVYSLTEMVMSNYYSEIPVDLR